MACWTLNLQRPVGNVVDSAHASRMSEDLAPARVVIVEDCPAGAVSWERFPVDKGETVGWMGGDPAERSGGVAMLSAAARLRHCSLAGRSRSMFAASS
jgi:hypothetical protein